MTKLGWIFTFYAIGVGIVALPFEYIWSWIIRPRNLKKDQFDLSKEVMLNDLLNLRKRAKTLEDHRPDIEKKQGVIGWIKKGVLRYKVIALDCESIVVERVSPLPFMFRNS